MIYNPKFPIDMIFNAAEDFWDYAELAQQPITMHQTIAKAYPLLKKTVRFKQAITEWNRRPALEKTWPNFKTHFRQAHQEFRETTDINLEESELARNNANLVQQVVTDSRVSSLLMRLCKMSLLNSSLRWQTLPPARTKHSNNLRLSSPKCNKLWCCFRPKSNNSTNMPLHQTLINNPILLVEVSTSRPILLAAVGPLSVIKDVVPVATEIAAVATNIANATRSSTAGRMVAAAILVLPVMQNFPGIKMLLLFSIKWAATPIISRQPDHGGPKPRMLTVI
jgi:hypothetical protein